MIRGLISPVKPKAIAVFSKETTFAPMCFAWLGKKKTNLRVDPSMGMPQI